jgi:hypothetical protein
MSAVVGKIFSSRLFKYDPSKRLFQSNLTDTPEILRELWADSLELGFGIRSEKTGRIVYFVLESAVREQGEYVAWNFYAHNPDDDERLLRLYATVTK